MATAVGSQRSRTAAAPANPPPGGRGRFVVTMREIIGAIPRVDQPDVVVEPESNSALQIAVEICRPRNWQAQAPLTTCLKSRRPKGLPLDLGAAGGRDSTAQFS